MPNLTPMIDMFTIILVFLLKTISVSYVGMKPLQAVQLPQSSSAEKPTRYLAVDVAPDGIYVERERVLELQNFALPSSEAQYETIFPLRAILKNRLDLGEIDSVHAMIRAHHDAPFDLIWRIMFTARQLGFERFENLALKQRNS